MQGVHLSQAMVVLTLATVLAADDTRTFDGSSPDSSSSTAGQSEVSPSNPSSISISFTSSDSGSTSTRSSFGSSSTSSSSTTYNGPNLIELIVNLFTPSPRSRRRPSPRSGAAARGRRRRVRQRGGSHLGSSPPQQQIQRSPQIQKTRGLPLTVQSSQTKLKEPVKEEQCHCNKLVTSEGGRCTTTRVLDGKKKGFCYTQPGACSLEHKDSQGRSWSFQPCRVFSSEKPTGPKQFDQKPILQRIKLVSECPRDRPCRTAKGNCCRPIGRSGQVRCPQVPSC